MSSPTIGVQSIRRAFAVLRALADGPLGVSEVAVASRIPKSTAARLLAALASEGAVEQVPGRAALPARAGPAGDRAGPRRDLGHRRDRPARARRPRPPSSARRPGSRSATAGRSSTSTRSSHRTRIRSQVRDWTGTRIPLHAVSSGQVFLAQLPAPVLVPLPRRAARGVHAAHADRRAARSWSGCARSAATATPGSATSTRSGISSVAAPIADARAEIVAAVHVHGPSYRFPAAGDEDRIAARRADRGGANRRSPPGRRVTAERR